MAYEEESEELLPTQQGTRLATASSRPLLPRGDGSTIEWEKRLVGSAEETNDAFVELFDRGDAW